METHNFLYAMKIIAESHSAKIIINHCKPNGMVPKLTTLGILDCVPKTIARLEEEGFDLSMKNGVLEVYDFSIVLKLKS